MPINSRKRQHSCLNNLVMTRSINVREKLIDTINIGLAEKLFLLQLLVLGCFVTTSLIDAFILYIVSIHVFTANFVDNCLLTIVLKTTTPTAKS
mmetsp:Transcript_21635/g.33041  ORF Transcript_21635/g.33041 Transcript_21635/m.33041 type:complete len:94 (-) Transcript_21635:110-391(-)